MDSDRIVDVAKTAAGNIWEFTGKFVGHEKAIAQGHAQQAAGRLQNAVGCGKDAIRESFKVH